MNIITFLKPCSKYKCIKVKLLALLGRAVNWNVVASPGRPGVRSSASFAIFDKPKGGGEQGCLFI